ncbi:hypothetical protein DVA67_005190 [Solirubrobacter sp. CPCC 204708]|uniref:Family 2 glycosyl transferase n=1 Tax=Solirubrobacter deserti TaxID=2282478 RepID=A0ABT4RHE0_9ACTN|nr:hypothetical protein [Solirubrobacter deserti]MBE2315359.1 hypothetical protein [Solirubrobacter deserti]MDA0137796.1 hypothetical protein [Solirubrobacter deserti]
MKLLLVVATFLALASSAEAASYAGRPIRQDGVTLPARVSGEDVQLAIGGSFATRFWPGVNLGATVPGHAPGELAPSRKDYDRWLEGMQDLGVRVVRVYTILRPRFYEALAAHNRRHPKTPLYFIQGVWIPEEDFLATRNAYATTGEFDREIADAVAVVHGDATLRPRRGHASGRYRTDVSRWLLAWSPGVEWDPDAVVNTDQVNAGAPPHLGRFIQSTPNATPMESWIAARLDHLATLEARRGWSRPITFTNWLTVDPLSHPMEPLALEDAVSVDAMHVQATPSWPGGFFASYHAYPYYPDFLRLEYPGGQPSPYAAYLRQLRQHHQGQALMVTEFGVPTGLGAAHRGPLGRDQGDHDEREAARIDAAMMREIEQEGYSGAVLFEWTDEWFKRTWNTQDVARPVERRPLWHNVLTNETQFGVIAVDPGRRPVVELDGRVREWRGARIKHDAAYLYLRARTPSTIEIDTRPGGGPDLRVILGPGRRARLQQPSALDPIPSVFRVGLRLDEWVSPRLILSLPLTEPTTGRELAPEYLDLGTVRWGGSDVRRLAAGSGSDVELRIPWLLLGFADPSSRTVFVPGATGVTFRRVASIRVDGRRYSWKTWNRVQWHERRKQGWPILEQAFERAAR